MAIKFRCSSCGKKLGVAEHLAGRSGRCPECGAVFTVPSPDAPPPPPPRVARQDDTDYHVAVHGADADLLFGRLAVKAGYLTEEQVKGLIEAQARDAGEGKRVTLGELCQSRRLLTSAQVQSLLLAQGYALLRAEDKRLGRLAVRNGFVSEDDVRAALDEQKRAYGESKALPRRIGEILVEMGAMSEQELHALLSAQARLGGASKPGSGPSEEGATGWLVLEAGNGARSRFRLGKRAILGRQPENEIPVEDDQASRQHARIEFVALAGQHLITDLNSRNGTYVNGKLVTGPVALSDGDRVQVGQTVLLYRAGADVATVGVAADETRGASPVKMASQARRETSAAMSALGAAGKDSAAESPRLASKTSSVVTGALARAATNEGAARAASPSPPQPAACPVTPAPTRAPWSRRRKLIVIAAALTVVLVPSGWYIAAKVARPAQQNGPHSSSTGGSCADLSPSSAIPPGSVLEAAVARLRSPDPLERLHAVRDVGSMGPTARPAVPELCRLLGDRTEDASVREAIPLNLASIDHGVGESLSTILSAITDDDERVRLASVSALGWLGVWNGEICSRLGEALLDRSPKVANQAAQQLELATATANPPKPSPFSAFARGLASPDPEVAARCLSNITMRLSHLTQSGRSDYCDEPRAEAEAAEAAAVIQAVNAQIPGSGAERDAVLKRLSVAIRRSASGISAEGVAVLLAGMDPLPVDVLAAGLRSADPHARQLCLRALLGARPAPASVLDAAVKVVEGDLFGFHHRNDDWESVDAMRLLVTNRPASIPSLAGLLRLQIQKGGDRLSGFGSDWETSLGRYVESESTAIVALVLVASGEPGVAEVGRVLQHEDHGARCIAAWALGFAGGTATAELETRLARKDSPATGAGIHRDPWWPKEQAQTEDSLRAAVTFLLRAFQDQDKLVRQQALASMRRLDSGCLPQGLRRTVREAVTAAGTVGTPTAHGGAATNVGSQNDSKVGAGPDSNRSGDIAGVTDASEEDDPACDAALKRFEEEYRTASRAHDENACMKAISRLEMFYGNPKVVKRLALVFSDGSENELVREYAIDALGQGHSPKALPFLTRAFRDPKNAAYVGSLLNAVANIPVPESAKFLGDVFRSQIRSVRKGEPTRIAFLALDSLGALKTSDSVEELLKILSELGPLSERTDKEYEKVSEENRNQVEAHSLRGQGSWTLPPEQREHAKELGELSKSLHKVLEAVVGSLSGITGQMLRTHTEWAKWWGANGRAFREREGKPPGETAASSSNVDDPEAKARALLNMAEQFAKNGMKDTAIEKLKEIVAKYPDTETAKAAKARIDELQAAGGQGK